MMEQSHLEGKVQKMGKYGELRKVPCTANNTVLNKQEFCDQVLMHYVITPNDLPKACDSCSKKHSLQHALQCKKGDLIGGCHDKVQDDLGVVGTQAISPHAFYDILRVQSSWDDKRKRDDPVDYQA
eukprot:14957683-Ditylum_brightwellii.AAC.1